jgi:2-methylcitrate dehydratase PrpD
MATPFASSQTIQARFGLIYIDVTNCIATNSWAEKLICMSYNEASLPRDVKTRKKGRRIVMTQLLATRTLATFLARLRFEELPRPVIERTKELFLDWIASALAGRLARPVQLLEQFAVQMGPSAGPSEILVSRRRTSPLFAALVNGASSHVVEQDDVHNGAVFHPATVVFPAVLAAAQETAASGRDFLAAAIVGYEAGVRIGSFLGRSHYRVFHTTGTAGTLAAAAGVAHLLRADPQTMLHALGSAGTQAAGLWEFLRDAADSKQLHTAKAAADGLLSAYIARSGFTGAQQILEGPQGMAAGMSSDADPGKLLDGLSDRWAVLETSFKYHASCRHTHPAADALLQLMQTHQLSRENITRIQAHVHQAAIDVLGPVVDPQTIHQAKFSMGFVLALIAFYQRAGVGEFSEETLHNPQIRSFLRRVEMVFDKDIDAAYPLRWIGKISVETTDGRWINALVETPKGDPENTLSRAEIENKIQQLAAFQQAASPEEVAELITRAWTLDQQQDLRNLLPNKE